MGKTVESYRMAIEDQIVRMNRFGKVLRVEDKKAFDMLMDACRNYASAGSNATTPVIFEPMVLSMLVSMQRQLEKQGKELDALKQRIGQP